MYSRKFSEKVELPAGYGGVALREEQRDGGQSDKEQMRFYEKSAPSILKKGEAQAEDGEDVGQVRRYDRSLCRPRRPLYRDEKGRRDRPPEAPFSKKEGECAKTQEPKGLLSSLFSLSGRSFTMEDIILAGLILLLLSEKEKGGKIDNELLLVLGFLLLGGR